MKKTGGLLMIGLLLWQSSLAFAAEPVMVADFNSGETIGNVGEVIEAWLKGDGSDTTQGCVISFVDGDAEGADTGKILKVDYDVDSENPAYNGFRFNFNGYDASAYSALSFYVKGDAEKGFTKRFKLEMIGANKRPSPAMVLDITGDWQQITIPFSEFFGMKDWTALHQIVIVFADIVNKTKVGTLYFDNFTFE